MKDLEDYDDYTGDEEGTRSRAMSWVVLGVALSGFVALAWYAYHSGSKSMQDGQMVIIAADDAPIKERPEDAGGEQFPHQDKTIYDTISPYRASESAKVEKLLPEPEEPVLADESNTATKTWVNDTLRRVSDAEEKINAQLEKAEAKKEETKEVAKAVVKEAPKAAPVTVAKEAPKQTTAAPVAEVKAAEAPTPAPVATKVEAPKAAPVASGSGFKIQLGAFGSDAEAKQNWARISSKHAATLSGHPHLVVKAEVPGKGTFYRLRASGFATADAAKQACAKLSAAGQACFFAGQ